MTSHTSRTKGQPVTEIKTLVAVFALKKAVKFLRDNPDVIPGELDDAIVKVLAAALGV
ncbi:hypothetical protein SEA_MORPHER26_7 [Mycobacterium phage Morpher26]|nr:hypothetical protein SEA_MORPHER26_7 [Mycobacterium phage Morpher26]QXN74482.1 hypothetical protein SEA_PETITESANGSUE_7 [Mycobacterium Phage PetiteSangsue]WAB09336.1 hypothetical protein SEA_PERPLEXER_7 [Mycobacterium phage Perplexer]